MGPARAEFQRVLIHYVFGACRAEELPSAAADAIGVGLDSPSLRQLAGSQGDDRASIEKLLQKALEELGLTLPSADEAARAYARGIAKGVLDGAIDPYEGASQIWHEVSSRFPTIAELTPFVACASEYENDIKHRDEYARLILEECRKFIALDDVIDSKR